MRPDSLIALLIPLIYWALVAQTMRRVRRSGASTRLSPEIGEERPLQICWYVVVVGWFAQPIQLALRATPPPFFAPIPALDLLPLDLLGAGGGIAGLVATRWCQRSMGSTWKMWVDTHERGPVIQTGPYRRIRHPIYGFQALALAGTWCLVPTPFLACVLALHVVCVLRKSLLEERHLVRSHGDAYRAYRARSGMFWPPLRRRP